MCRVSGKPPFHPENGGCLHGVCSPCGFFSITFISQSDEKEAAVVTATPWFFCRALPDEDGDCCEETLSL